MKKFKKVLALALAFAMVAALIPVMGKNVMAADSATWTAATYISDKELPTANKTNKTGVQTLEEFKVGDALTVKPLDQPEGHYWGNNGGTSHLTGTDNARSSTGKAVSKDYAPETGTALKITTAKKGTVIVNLQQNADRTGYITKFESGELTGGEELWSYTPAKKADYDYEFEAEPGYDYYVYISGSKAGYKSITFTPAAEKSVVSTLGIAYREEGGSWGNGVRFGAELDMTSADNIEESGTLVARQDAVGDGTELKVGIDKCKKVERTTVWKQTDNVLQYTLVVTNIPEDNKDTVLVARPYVKLKDGTYIYGEQISGSWNKVKAEVASGN